MSATYRRPPLWGQSSASRTPAGQSVGAVRGSHDRTSRRLLSVEMMPRSTVVALILAALAGCGGQDGGREGRGAPASGQQLAGQAARLGLAAELPPSLQRACARLRRLAPPRADHCLPLVPEGKAKLEFAQGSSLTASRRDAFAMSVAGSSLNQLDGTRIQTNGGHWSYDVAWSPTARQRLTRFSQRPPNAQRSSRCRELRLNRQAVTACLAPPYEKGGGFYGGHALYLWQHDDVTYVVSAHGYDNDPRVRAMTAALIERVVTG